MLGFSQVLKPIKWQDLLQEGTGAKIHFSEKKYFKGMGHKYLKFELSPCSKLGKMMLKRLVGCPYSLSSVLNTF